MEKTNSTNHSEIDGYVAAARSIVPELAKTSAASELARQLDSAALRTMRNAGLNRLLVPKRYGGLELPIRAQLYTCRETARGCSATSWVQMVCGAHDFVLGGFSDECLREVFAEGPDVLVPGTLSAQGTVHRTPGGWLLEGRWQFCSGVDLSPWIMIGSRQIDAERDPEPWGAVHLILRKEDIEVDDTWHVLGMRGTGSKDIVAKGAFVPLRRSMPTVPLFTGVSPHASSPVYRLPVLPALASMVAATILGVAERGYEVFLERTRVRKDVYVGDAKAASAGIQRRIAEARSELDAASHLQAGPWGLGTPAATARVGFNPRIAWLAVAQTPGAHELRTRRDGWWPHPPGSRPREPWAGRGRPTNDRPGRL